MKRSGIYLWSLGGVPKYVGKSVDVRYRMMRNHNDNEALNRAAQKYGYEAFKKEVICYCEPDELNELEEYYIRELHTHCSENGYNLTWGRKNSTETLKRMSAAHKGITHSDEAKKKSPLLNLVKEIPSLGRNPIMHRLVTSE